MATPRYKCNALGEDKTSDKLFFEENVQVLQLQVIVVSSRLVLSTFQFFFRN